MKKDRLPKFITVTGRSGRKYTAPVVVQGNSYGFDLAGSGAEDVGLQAWANVKYVY